MTKKNAQPDRIQASFLISAPDLKRCPGEGIPEIAFAGRSNAGKSSVLNRITGSKKMARTSKTPGRTQLLNFFDTREGGRLVDLPGYGFARTSRRQQRQWQQHIEDYLSRRESLVGVVLVMDARHPFQDFDVHMIDWAVASNMPMHLLLNKADKLRQNARRSTLHQASKRISTLQGISTALFSAQTGLGSETTIKLLREWFRAGLKPA